MKLSIPVELDNAHLRFVRRYARRLAVEFPAYNVNETLALSNLLWRSIQCEMRREQEKTKILPPLTTGQMRRGKAVIK